MTYYHVICNNRFGSLFIGFVLSGIIRGGGYE
jgi:hypothetical protein